MTDWREALQDATNRAMTSFTLAGHSADFTPAVPTGISPGG